MFVTKNIQSVAVVALGIALLFLAHVAFAWVGPTDVPPGDNAEAPINVSSASQSKFGALSVEGFANFGNTLFGGTSRYLNFDTVNPSDPAAGYGIRDNAGTMEFKNSGGAWAAMGGGGAGTLWIPSGTTGMYAADDRNVGIGATPSANDKLNVAQTGGQNMGALYVQDGVRSLRVVPNLGLSGFNPLSQTNDVGLIYNGGSSDTGGLTIGQWSSSPRGIRIAPNGNVGVGAPTPQSLLSLGSLQTTIKAAMFDDGSGTNLYGMGMSGGALTFGAGIAAAGTPQMTLRWDGALGLGTTGYLGRFHINGWRPIVAQYTSGWSEIWMDGSSNKSAYMHFGGDATNEFRIARAGDNIGSWEANPVRIDMDAPDGALFLSEAGNLGLGNTAPAGPLDIWRNQNAWSWVSLGNNNGGASAGLGWTLYNGTDRLNVELSGTGAGRYAHILSSAPNHFYFDIINTGDYVFRTTAGYTERMRIMEGGNVGIGTASPAQKLDVNGTVRATSFLYSSDARLKEDVKKLEDGLGTVLALNPVSFKWNEKTERNGREDIGFIAQEVEKIVPQAVNTDATGMKSVDYPRLVPVLVKALQEQQTQIDALKADIAELKASR